MLFKYSHEKIILFIKWENPFNELTKKIMKQQEIEKTEVFLFGVQTLFDKSKLIENKEEI